MNVLQNKLDCCGCKACEAACPVGCLAMTLDDEGFWYPQVDMERCVHCRACKKVCPVLQSCKRETETAPLAYAAYHTDDCIRVQSSSGGVFTALAQVLLDEGGTVFGAAMTEDYQIVQHISVKNKMDLDKIRGSKYLQSDTASSFQEVKDLLKAEEIVLYTGTPCQIEGLKSFLGRDYDNLYTQDIICHGVPSPKVWQCYLGFCESRRIEKAQKVSFRDKYFGWKSFALLIQYSNGKIQRKRADRDPFMRAFLQNICLRPSCSHCHFKKLNRVSDVTLADFWGAENVVPALDNNEGLSLVMLHSRKGEALFSKAQKVLRVVPVDAKTAIQYNTAMVASVRPHENRGAFFSELTQMPFDQLVRRNLKCPFSILKMARVAYRKVTRLF